MAELRVTALTKKGNTFLPNSTSENIKLPYLMLKRQTYKNHTDSKM